MFVFPFDYKDRNAKETYKDISEKLKALSYPANLVDVTFEIGNTIGFYGKSIEETHSFKDTVAERICLLQSNGDKINPQYLWLFSRYDGIPKCRFCRFYSVS